MQLVAAPGQVRQGVAQVGIIVRCAVDCLGNALAVGIVAVGDGLPIERRQQVRPIGVAVGVGAACCPDVAVY